MAANNQISKPKQGQEQKVSVKRTRRRLYEQEPEISTPAKSAPAPVKEPAPREVLQEPGQKEVLSSGIIKESMYWSLGIGLIPIPLFDFAANIAIELKMIRDICKVYGLPFKGNRGRAFVLSLIGSIHSAVFSRAAFAGLSKLIPGAGFLVGAASASVTYAAITYAVGRVFVMHCETGGTLLHFDTGKLKAHFQNQLEEGAKKAGEMKEKSKNSTQKATNYA